MGQPKIPLSSKIKGGGGESTLEAAIFFQLIERKVMNDQSRQ